LSVRVALLAVLVLCGTACHAPPGKGAASPGGLVVAAGATRLQLDSGHSEVLVLVYGAGSLARLGHNHAIAIADLQGELWIAQDLRRSVFSLQFPVAAMRLDDRALRAQQGSGFQEVLTDEDIDGTRTHMLDTALLDALHYPTIALRSEGIEPAGSAWVAHTAVQVRAYTGHIDVPVKLEQAAGQVVLSGGSRSATRSSA